MAWLGICRKEDIFWLEVTVYDSFAVKIGHAAYNLAHNQARIHLADRSGTLQVGHQVSAGSEFGKVVNSRRRLSRSEERYNVELHIISIYLILRNLPRHCRRTLT